ncbi:MAG: helix-turn-helix domain-containing protein [Sterolibacteriaceae bacterium MAG5]|nr:helix-turn-helix domain-containing protein [Candidatus Nitricoxidireducens bremensis]
MAKKTSLLSDIHAARRTSGLNQTAFWTRFGVTQSGGSRYESGRNMPTPLKLLIALYEAGKIDDAMLEDAKKALAKAKKK